MFTGIIEEIGVVEAIQHLHDGARLRIRHSQQTPRIPAGASLAVDGVCLTALEDSEGSEGMFTAEIMGETLRCTTLGGLVPGESVNLERCVRAGDRFDGHILQGHIDGVAEVVRRVDHSSWTTLRLEIPRELAAFAARKGSIAVQGVSLTVTEVSAPSEHPAWFEVGLIPATLQATTLGRCAVGERLNLETDAVAKYLLRAREVQEHLLTGQESAASSVSADAPARVEAALAAMRRGQCVVVVDDQSRENEGDLVLAASLATEQSLAFLIRHTSGLVCAPMPAERADALELAPMVAQNQDPHGTAYTVTCDAATGIGTGISAADRARTLRVLAAAETQPDQLTRPGHLLPLRAHPGGLPQRRGHTEAAVALTEAAGLPSVGCIAELVHDDGTMMRAPALQAFAQQHGLVLVSTEDLVRHLPSLSAPADSEQRDAPCS